MNPCLWFLVLQEFGALQTSLLKHNRRLKQRDSLPLNAARGAGGSEVPSVFKGQSSGRGSVARSPQKLKLLAHLYIIICIFALRKIFFRRSRGQSSSGPMVNTLVPPPQSSPFPVSPLPFLPLPESGGSGILPEKF